MPRIFHQTPTPTHWVSSSYAAKLGNASGVYDITKYGGMPGNADVSQALTNAWKETCASTTPSQAVIPHNAQIFTQRTLQKGLMEAVFSMAKDQSLGSKTNVQKKENASHSLIWHPHRKIGWCQHHESDKLDRI
ncbi:hypothetical protein Nepgr_012840 [Nepenthes gracilis]|uniref:Uncharacterized protein n=1 Tax=Nepenthes gracilis TaxID=150966 RepID=A0AAD3SI09_NEPGR|nr:hypothetical protein Nepgr_012840 [Nepenthes gracilis]